MSDWIEWRGGENPVPGKLVEVKYRNAVFAKDKSDNYRWTHICGNGDIIAYRVIDEPTTEKSSPVYAPEVFQKTITYQQEPDSCSDLEGQDLTLETRDCGAGPYLVIKTEEWALEPEQIDGFCEMLKGFIK